MVEPTGSETYVSVHSHGHELICVFRQRINAKPGESISITPQPDLVHVFDRDTGKRI